MTRRARWSRSHATLHGVTSVDIKEFQATVENDKVKNFRVDAKVSFRLERT